MTEVHLSRLETRRRKKRQFTIWLSAGIGIVLLLLIAAGYSYGPRLHLQGGIMSTVKTIFKLNGSLTARVAENSPGQLPAKNIKLTIDGKPVKPANTGPFKIDGLSTGAHTVKIEGEGYDALSERVDIKRGGNSRAFLLNLTPEESAKRWIITKKENRHADTYLYLHPDEKAKMKKADYVKFKAAIQDEYTIKITKAYIYRAELLKSWKHPISGKIYKDVAKIKVTAVFEVKKSATAKSSWYAYAQKRNGRWTFFATK